MIAKKYYLKPKALLLRKGGHSIGEIERKLKISRSTLSGWFNNIKLDEDQKAKLIQNSLRSLASARKKAVKWHHLEKRKRLEIAKIQAIKTLGKINYKNNDILELALAMLYLGEGDKTQQTSMGSTNPLILKFFVKSLNRLFGLNSSNVKYEIHLRSDQDEKESIKYWSGQLKVPTSKFTFVKDKRIVKSKTYPEYKGVCVVHCGNIAIQRRLMNVSQEYCKMQLH